MRDSMVLKVKVAGLILGSLMFFFYPCLLSNGTSLRHQTSSGFPIQPGKLRVSESCSLKIDP